MIHSLFSGTDKKRFFKLDKKLVNRKLPITKWLPKYNLSTLLSDLLAGLTVSLTEIPQAIAYAGVAGLSPEYGLYSCIMGGFVYAVFGSCKDINVGPTSIMSLMIQPYVISFGPAVAVMLSFVSGLIIFVLGLFNLGFVIEFFSFPIVSGFTCAASLEIASLQLNSFFGIEGESDAFLDAVEEFFDKIHEVRLWDSILAFVSLLCLIFLKEIRRFGGLQHRSDWSKARNVIGIIIFFISLARNVIIICVGVAIAYCLRENAPFTLSDEVKGGFPPFKIPAFTATHNGTEYYFWDMAAKVRISFLFIPLIAILESVTIAKTFTHGKTLDATQEILAIGITNVLSSFVSSMPVTGAFSRSAINNASGVKTPLGGIFTSLVTLLAIGFLTPVFYYVPKSTMAAVIICTMIYLFEYHAFVVLWKHKKQDLIPFLATFVCCLTISLEYGILIGIVINVLFVLYPSARPKITIVTTRMGKHGDVYLVKPIDNLYFPAAENLRQRVLKHGGQNTLVVIDGECLRNVDITVAKSLVALSAELLKRGNSLVLWNFEPSVMKVCVGLNRSLQNHFQSGHLENIVEELPAKYV